VNAPALQDLIAHNHCFGCGPGNERGLRICTAIAAAHFDAGRVLGPEPALHYVTAELTLKYERPTPLRCERVLFAHPVRLDERRYRVSAELRAAGKVCVTAEVDAVRVPESWMRACKVGP